MSTLWSRPIMHVEVVELALSVVKGGKTSKAVKKVPMYKYCTCDHMSSSKQYPIWKKEKEILKVKTERKIPYQRQKRIVNIYNISKPNMPSYASALKVTSKDSLTEISQFKF